MTTPPTREQDLVAALIEAHETAAQHETQLAQARQERRQIATALHEAGHSYRWIGQQIGLTAQAVEGFIKYRQRRSR